MLIYSYAIFKSSYISNYLALSYFLLFCLVGYYVYILLFGPSLPAIPYSDPNFQNQPRGKTFPIRKVVTSRFDKGSILEVDFSQLEFRTAVYLAQDKQGMEDIKNKIDVHQYTASIIGVSRQDAKAHTFKPLYGGVTGTEDEKRYYSKFLEKYNSFGTEARIKKASNLAKKYQIDSVPTIIINGKFLTSH